MTDKQRMWCNLASLYGGSFVSTFAKACFAADKENFYLLQPVLNQLIIKYPSYTREEIFGKKEYKEYKEDANSKID